MLPKIVVDLCGYLNVKHRFGGRAKTVCCAGLVDVGGGGQMFASGAKTEPVHLGGASRDIRAVQTKGA